MSEGDDFKTCNICQASKHIGDFYKGMARCRACHLEMQRERYAFDPEFRQKKIENSRRQQAKMTPEQKAAKAARDLEYYQNNREALNKQAMLNRREARLSEAGRQAQRAAKFKARMGITLDERDRMFEEQGSACCICRSTEPNGPEWCTDHDHECCPTGKKSCGKCIRGILCWRCNTLLGHAKDSVETLSAAIDYLTAWQEKQSGREQEASA